MIIFADNEARPIIKDLCDAALRIGGLQNLEVVTRVLGAMKPLAESEKPEPEPEPEPEKEDDVDL